MLCDSVLGKLYTWYLNSFLFALLRGIYRPFSRAFPNCALSRFLKRESRVERFYSRFFLTRWINAVWDFFARIFRAVYGFFLPAADGSFFVRIVSGSFCCNFEFILCAFILVMFVTPHALWSNGYCVIAAAALFLLYAFMAAAGKRKIVYPYELGFPFFLFVIACVISLFFTSDLNDSVRILSFFAAAFLLCYVVMADITDEGRLKRLMGYIYAAVALTSLYAIAQRFMGVEVSASFTDLDLNVGVPGRVYSTLDNPNNYAEFIVLFTPLCVAYAMNQKTAGRKFVFCCGVALPIIALVMTYSRSGWLSLMLAAAVFIYYCDKRVIPVVIIAALCAVPLLPASMLTRFSTIFNPADSSASHRLATWQGIIAMIKDYGLTGIGMGPYTFAELYPAYAVEGATKGVYHSQMLYMELILETGALGFVSFMWMMLRNMKDSAYAITRSNNRTVRGALVACLSSFVGIAVASIFEYIWYYPRVLFAYFILLGILLAALRMTPREMEVNYEKH